jgi:hypothetical protein
VENEPPARVASACAREAPGSGSWVRSLLSLLGFFQSLSGGLCVQIVQCTRLVQVFRFSSHASVCGVCVGVSETCVGVCELGLLILDLGF